MRQRLIDRRDEMTANQLISRLINAEMFDAKNDPQMATVIRDERMTLQVIVQTKQFDRLAAAASEAVHVARMWGLTI